MSSKISTQIVEDTQKDIEYLKTKLKLLTDPNDKLKCEKQIASLEDSVVIYCIHHNHNGK